RVCGSWGGSVEWSAASEQQRRPGCEQCDRHDECGRNSRRLVPASERGRRQCGRRRHEEADCGDETGDEAIFRAHGGSSPCALPAPQKRPQVPVIGSFVGGARPSNEGRLKGVTPRRPTRPRSMTKSLLLLVIAAVLAGIATAAASKTSTVTVRPSAYGKILFD